MPNSIFSFESFRPTYRFHRVASISTEFLKERGIKSLILDKDETLIETGADHICPDIALWIDMLKKAGVGIVVCSNSARAKAVRAFAAKVGIAYVLCGPAFIWGKPWARGFRKALTVLGSRKDETAVIGDQLLTDIWGGNCCGMRTIMVSPLSGKDRLITKLTGRALEKVLLAMLVKRHLLPSYSDPN